jgi:hypothetical protein
LYREEFFALEANKERAPRVPSHGLEREYLIASTPWTIVRDTITRPVQPILKPINPTLRRTGDNIIEGIQKPVGTIDRELPRARQDINDGLDAPLQACRGIANYVTSTNTTIMSASNLLTPNQKHLLRRHLRPSINLDEIRVFYNSILPNPPRWMSGAVRPSAQTFGNHIYLFAGRHPESIDQLIEIAHELVHSEQYASRGGLTGFCRSYAIGYTRGLDYYNNPLEVEAFNRNLQFIREISLIIPDPNRPVIDPHGELTIICQASINTPWNRRAFAVPCLLPAVLSYYNTTF